MAQPSRAGLRLAGDCEGIETLSLSLVPCRAPAISCNTAMSPAGFGGAPTLETSKCARKKGRPEGRPKFEGEE